MKAPLIWINGFPGTGKLTVAKEIHDFQQQSVVVSNHSLIDPVEHRLGPNARDHPLYQTQRQEAREEAFDKWVHNPNFAEHMIIFTDFQSTTGVGPTVAREYETAARRSCRPFMPVYLSSKLSVNLERATSLERRRGGTTKLTDVKLLENIICSPEIFQFETGIDLCTTQSSVKEVAKAILTAVAGEGFRCQREGLIRDNEG